MKSFIKQVLAVMVGISALAMLCLLALTAATAADDSAIDSPSVLVFDLDIAINDKGVSPTPLEMMQGASTPTPARDVIEAIRTASNDSEILAMFLHGNGSNIGSANARELKLAIEEFKSANKKVYAWIPELDEKSFYFGSIADELWIAPFGMFQYNGIASEVSYYKDLLAKIGVNIQVSRVGKYKSAVEPFLLTEMSDANREQIDNLINDLFSVLLEESASSRNLPNEQLWEMVNGISAIRANEALERGLIDDVLYFDQVLDHLKKVAPSDHGFSQVSLLDYSAQNQKPNDDSAEGRIALVYAEGEIYDGSGDTGIAGDTLAKELRELRFDEEIEAVVMRVNSPGGSAAASEFILREVELLRAAGKPVVVSMGNVAASGGYWISSKADKILVQPNTITGSIGVFGMFPEVSGLLNTLGVNVQTVKTGPTADSMSIMRPQSDEELAIIQSFIDEIYDAFVKRVSEGRNIPESRVREIAQGRVWSGLDAIELGLADSLGGIDEAAKLAAEIAGLEDWTLVNPQPEDVGLVDSIISGLLDEGGSDEIARWSSISQAITQLPKFGARNGIYAMLPFNLEIH